MARNKAGAGIDPGISLLANAARMIVARLDALLEFESCLRHQDRVYELHQMRIAAKRLRYTMEIFQSLYTGEAGTGFGEALDEIKQLQESLGDIHDADFLAPQLAKHLAGLLREGYGVRHNGLPVAGVHHIDYRACQGLLTISEETRDERDRVYRALLKDWERLGEQRTFDKLRELLENAVSAETRDEPAIAETTSVQADLPQQPEEASSVAEDAHDQPTTVEAADVRVSVPGRSRRRKSVRINGASAAASDGGGHSGDGPDTGESAPEGGV